MAVIGQGFKSSFTDAVNTLFVADYSVSAGANGDPLTNKAADAVAAAPGVTAVSQMRSGEARVGGATVFVTGVDESLTKVVDMTWKQGSSTVPEQLGTSGAFVLDQYADDKSLSLGSRLAIETPTGKTMHVHVIGILDPPKGGSPFGEITVSKATFDESFANHDNLYTFVNVRGGPSPANTAALEKSLAAFPAAVVETRDEFRNSRTSNITQSLQILYALLGLSVIVSLFGVINTLVLSVFERTRELGMLRAIGMTRRQVRRMIRHESIVTALIGATLGIGVGMFLAVLTTTALSKYGVVFAVPYGTLVVFVGIAILAGVLAAILPARRASRLNILNALQYE